MFVGARVFNTFVQCHSYLRAKTTFKIRNFHFPQILTDIEK